MGAPHNKERYGELWDQNRIDVCLEEINAVRDLVTLSGQRLHAGEPFPHTIQGLKGSSH